MNFNLFALTALSAFHFVRPPAVNCDAFRPITATQKPPVLGYTLASYNVGDWSSCEANVKLIQSEGFGVVTLSQAYTGSGETASTFTIDASHVPSVEDEAKCIQSALAVGLKVILKPHIDGGWRGGYDFDPARSRYFDLVISRELKAIALAKKQSGCAACKFGLTMSTETNKSEAKYSQSWLNLLGQTRNWMNQNNLRSSVQLTHDLMFDFYRTAGASNYVFGRYLAGLDSLSLSQYTPLGDGTVEGVVSALETYENTARAYLKTIMPNGSRSPILNFGEFGIGQGGLSQPWVAGSRNENDTVIGDRGMLQYLYTKNGQASTNMQYAVFWTVGLDYDIMGNNWGAIRSVAAQDVLNYNKNVCGN